MTDLARDPNTLGALLEETRGVVGVALGTAGGQLRAVVGSVVDGDASAAVAAALTDELGKLGEMLGLGELGVASLKAPSAARVFARQAGAAVVIELDPKRPLTELETKLRTVAWAPGDGVTDPLVSRVSTRPIRDRGDSGVSPAPSPPASSSSVSPLPSPPPEPVRPSALPRAIATPRPISRTSPPPPPGSPARSSPATSPPIAIGASTLPPSTHIPHRAVRPTPAPPANGLPRATPTPSAMMLPSQMKAVGSGPVFTGDLKEFSLPDLLEFLRNSHRTGLLMCTTPAGAGTIHLSRGMIIAADSPHAVDLREHFITHPEIEVERRRQLATLPPECFGDDLVEGVLVGRDLATPDEVERARTARIYSAFREMMTWTTGRFSFDPGVPIVTNPALALSAQSILMHLYQEQDEQGR
ncbi:MAG TPA: DUF4388 domain-containing protein [Kofleriaceae bacterium]|nr:DUF4388 domain-containing protein [Kofleriaceae bacterium]